MTESGIRKIVQKIAKQHSQRAFREFYDLFYDRFFRIAYYYLKNEECAREVVLDSFMKLWEKRSVLPEIANMEDYCFILVKNTSLNYLEKESRRPTFSSDTPADPEAGDCSPEETLITEELFSVYVKALDQLPTRCREVFIKVREDKQSYAQVAEELGISPKTVDAQLQKAVSKLKTVINIYLTKDR